MLSARSHAECPVLSTWHRAAAACGSRTLRTRREGRSVTLAKPREVSPTASGHPRQDHESGQEGRGEAEAAEACRRQLKILSGFSGSGVGLISSRLNDRRAGTGGVPWVIILEGARGRYWFLSGNGQLPQLPIRR